MRNPFEVGLDCVAAGASAGGSSGWKWVACWAQCCSLSSGRLLLARASCSARRLLWALCLLYWLDEAGMFVCCLFLSYALIASFATRQYQRGSQ
jgi:hypothetical protein